MILRDCSQGSSDHCVIFRSPGKSYRWGWNMVLFRGQKLEKWCQCPITGRRMVGSQTLLWPSTIEDRRHDTGLDRWPRTRAGVSRSQAQLWQGKGTLTRLWLPTDHLGTEPWHCSDRSVIKSLSSFHTFHQLSTQLNPTTAFGVAQSPRLLYTAVPPACFFLTSHGIWYS